MIIKDDGKKEDQSQTARAQRERIRERLKLGPLTTFEGREKLNVPHVAGRVHELRRDEGLSIKTEWSWEYAAGGSKHRIAIYTLSQEDEHADI